MATVADLMRREFLSVRPSESLLEADHVMRLARIRHLPVVEEGELIGILSNRDVAEVGRSRLEVESEARLEHLRGVPVEEAMTRDPVVATRDLDLAEAALLMLRHKIGCLPVVESTHRPLRPVGIVTETDLVRAAYAPGFRESSD